MAKQKQQEQETITFKDSFESPEDRVAYYEGRVEFWTTKLTRLIHPPKIERAKRRLAHYVTRLAAAKKLVS